MQGIEQPGVRNERHPAACKFCEPSAITARARARKACERCCAVPSAVLLWITGHALISRWRARPSSRRGRRLHRAASRPAPTLASRQWAFSPPSRPIRPIGSWPSAATSASSGLAPRGLGVGAGWPGVGFSPPESAPFSRRTRCKRNSDISTSRSGTAIYAWYCHRRLRADTNTQEVVQRFECEIST